MNLIKPILTSALAIAINITAFAGYKPGDEVKDFSLKSTDNKMISLNGYKNARGFIIVFTCNHCPFAKLYQERMNAMNKEYASKGFHVIAISSNDAIAVPEDNFEEMTARAKEQHYNFPYLYDETQGVARAFGAVKTPHAFVLLKENGKWIVKYSGSIDDNGAEPDKVKNAFVKNAVDALLQNEPVQVSSTKSVGCAIKWKP
jgi:peroxiredoxin